MRVGAEGGWRRAEGRERTKNFEGGVGGGRAGASAYYIPHDLFFIF